MNRFSPRKIVFLLAAALLTVAVAVYAQQKASETGVSCPIAAKGAAHDKSHANCPMPKKGESGTAETKKDKHSEHPDHHAMVMKNGETAMGFSQTATTHHFLLAKDGGVIQVEVNEAQDAENLGKIRRHLAEIAGQFKKGNFQTPFSVHGRIPPGASEMDRLRDQIEYAYEETERGARVRITTADAQALVAIHNFLRFQIEDHRTGDPLDPAE